MIYRPPSRCLDGGHGPAAKHNVVLYKLQWDRGHCCRRLRDPQEDVRVEHLPAEFFTDKQAADVNGCLPPHPLQPQTAPSSTLSPRQISCCHLQVEDCSLLLGNLPTQDGIMRKTGLGNANEDNTEDAKTEDTGGEGYTTRTRISTA